MESGRVNIAGGKAHENNGNRTAKHEESKWQPEYYFLCDYSSVRSKRMPQYDANSYEALEIPKLSPRKISSDADTKEDTFF